MLQAILFPWYRQASLLIAVMQSNTVLPACEMHATMSRQMVNKQRGAELDVALCREAGKGQPDLRARADWRTTKGPAAADLSTSPSKQPARALGTIPSESQGPVPPTKDIESGAGAPDTPARERNSADLGSLSSDRKSARQPPRGRPSSGWDTPDMGMGEPGSLAGLGASGSDVTRQALDFEAERQRMRAAHAPASKPVTSDVRSPAQSCHLSPFFAVGCLSCMPMQPLGHPDLHSVPLCLCLCLLLGADLHAPSFCVPILHYSSHMHMRLKPVGPSNGIPV